MKNIIKKHGVLTLLLLPFLLLLIAGCADKPMDTQDIMFETYEDDGAELALEEMAPDFSLTSLAGEDISLSDYQGKIVLLSFFSTT